MKFSHKISGIMILTLMWFSHSSAQTITATAGTVTSCAGNVVVPVNVSGFNNISAMSMVLQYDTTILQYNGYQNFSPDLLPGLYEINQDKGRFILTWLSVSPVTISDGSFIELLFTTNGGVSNLVWDLSTQGNCEFSDVDGNPISSTFTNGQVNAPGMVARLNSQPTDGVVIEGNNVSFNYSVSGAVSFQWQESTDGGSNWSALSDGGIYSGTAGNYFTLYGPNLSMDGYMYRSVFEGGCPPPDTTNPVTLTVKPVPPTITLTAGTMTSCAGNINVPVTIQDFTGVAAFSLTLDYDPMVLTYNGYQGLNNSVDGTNFIINNFGNQVMMSWFSSSPASIANDTLLELLFTSIGQHSDLNWDTNIAGNCEIVDSDGVLINTIYQNGDVYSPGNPPSIYTQPVDALVLDGDDANFSVGASSVNTYQWQLSTDSGTTWSDLADGAGYANTQWYYLYVYNVNLSMTAYQFRCHITGPCNPDVFTQPATLFVSPYPQIIKASIPFVNRCEDSLTVPVMVENFDGVAAISMAIDFDTSLLAYTGLREIHPGITGSVIDNAVKKTIYISWASITPVSIGNTVLLKLGFTAKKNGNGNLTWNTGSPGNIEFSDPDGKVIQTDLINGNIDVQLTGGVSVSYTGLNPVYCSNETTSILIGTPVGGTFTGPGIFGSVFDPAAAATGTNIVDYTYTNGNGCVFTASQQTLVHPAPVTDLGGSQIVCNTDTVTLDAGEGFVSYEWSNTGSVTNLLEVTGAGDYWVTVTDSNNCIASSPNTSVLFNTLPEIPVITVSGELQFFGGDSVLLYAPPGYDSYNWDSGDTTESITVKASGQFRVKVKDANGCTSLLSDPVIVDVDINGCLADFSFEVDAVDNTIIHFKDTSKGAVSSWYWNFDDGNISTDQDVDHKFNRTGTYQVCLNTYDAAKGCVSEVCKEVNIGVVELVADFDYLADPVTREVTFTNNSTGSITDYYWTYGDGSVYEGSENSHIYNEPGIYTVCLAIKNNATGTFTGTCKDIKVGTTSCDIKAGFSYFVEPVSREVSFAGNSTGIVQSYFWTFGDGSSSAIENPSHTYSSPGYYQVSLSVRNNLNNCMDMFTQAIQVGSADCRAGYSYMVNPLNNTVSFKDESNEGITYYYWDFGDGSYSVLQNPENTYSSAGMYIVGQTVMDGLFSCIDYMVQPVQVGDIDCAAEFVSYIDSAKSTAYFINRVMGESTALLWSFGDGSFSTNENPVHKFTAGGIYSAGLNTYDFNSGCMDYYEQMILIGGLGKDCEADFVYRVDPANSNVVFSNKSVGDIVGSVWNFGDQSDNSQEPDPDHTYAVAGYYYVCLNVTNSEGISNMSCKWVLIEGAALNNCRADFMFTIDSANHAVKFVNNSFGDINSYSWDFGDNKADSVSILKDPDHTYNGKGYYMVQLKVEGTGCVSNEYKLLNVAEAQLLKAAFGYEARIPDKKFAGYPVDLVSASSGDGATVEWDFGDKQLKKAGGKFIVMDSTSRIVRHYYELPGRYEVCLRISDPVTKKSDVYCSFVYTKDAPDNINEFNEPGLNLDVYPNPFVDYTTINYALPVPQFIEIAIFDQLGRRLETLVKTREAAGNYQLSWETKTLTSGVYHLTMIAGDKIITKQLVITK